MEFSLVSAEPKRDRIGEIRTRLENGEIGDMRPFGKALTRALEHAGFDPAGGVIEDAYAGKGSGMQLAYGVLERVNREILSNDEATAIAARVVQSAVERDTGSGNGVSLVEVTGDGAVIHGQTDFSEVLYSSCNCSLAQ